MSNLQNLEAKRALFAFNAANDGESKGKEFNYSAAVRELPSMIRMNGLRAAMAYFHTKGMVEEKNKEKAHGLVFKQLRDWFKADDEPTKMMSAKFKTPTDKKPEARFMEILFNLTDDEYRIVQAETLTLANWLIRFVKTEDSNNQSNTSTDDAAKS